MAIGVRASGTLTEGNGAAGGWHGHAEGSLVMLSTFATLSVDSAKQLTAQRARPFAAAEA